MHLLIFQRRGLCCHLSVPGALSCTAHQWKQLDSTQKILDHFQIVEFHKHEADVPDFITSADEINDGVANTLREFCGWGAEKLLSAGWCWGCGIGSAPLTAMKTPVGSVGVPLLYEIYGRELLQRDQLLLEFAEVIYQELENKQNA